MQLVKQSRRQLQTGKRFFDSSKIFNKTRNNSSQLVSNKAHFNTCYPGAENPSITCKCVYVPTPF